MGSTILIFSIHLCYLLPNARNSLLICTHLFRTSPYSIISFRIFFACVVNARPITIFDRLFAFNMRIFVWETGIPYAHSSTISGSCYPFIVVSARIHLRFINWLINKFEISYTMLGSINANCFSMQLHMPCLRQMGMLSNQNIDWKFSFYKYSNSICFCFHVDDGEMPHNTIEFFVLYSIRHHLNYICDDLILKHLFSFG